MLNSKAPCTTRLDADLLPTHDRHIGHMQAQLHFMRLYPQDVPAQVVFDGANPGGFKALLLSFYAPELHLGAVLPHQVPNLHTDGAKIMIFLVRRCYLIVVWMFG